MSVVTKTEREEYTVTVNAPTEFLTSTTTVYPVTVDPTFRIDETELITTPDGDYTANAIEDLCIYTSSPSPTSGYLSNVGNYYYDSEGETVYTSRMLYKINSDFEDLMNLSYYISSPQFFHARLYVKGFAVEEEVTLVAAPFSADWSSGVSQCVDEETYYSHSSSGQSTTVVTNTLAQSIGIDITNVLVYYSTHSSTYNNFNMCVSTSDEGNNYDDSCYDRVKIYQTEDSESDVYISIDYSPLSGSFYINSLESGKFLTGEPLGDTNQSIYTGSAYQKWTFIYKGENRYEIVLTDNENRVLLMDSASNVGIDNRSDVPQDRYTWEITFHSDELTIFNIGQWEYLYGSNASSELTGTSETYDAHWRICKVNEFVPLISFSSNDISMCVGSTVKIPITTKTPNNATWASSSDYEFKYESSNIYINNNTITAQNPDAVIITATHKCTGIVELIGCVVYANEDISSMRTTRDSTNKYTLCVAEQYNGQKYWFQLGDDGSTSDVLLISSENINWLHTEYNEYIRETITNPFAIEYCVYQAKVKVEEAIENNQLYNVDFYSDEYYGLWLYFSLVEETYRASILELVSGVNTALYMYNAFNRFCLVTTQISALANSNKIITLSQMESYRLLYSALKPITDIEAVTNGITDVTVYMNGRPTWRQSELYLGIMRFTKDAGYKYNASFDSNCNPVDYGTLGSFRPDFYNPSTNHVVDVKNYTITTETGRASLVNNVVNQYLKRVPIFGDNATYEVVIDVRGQNYTQEMLNEVESAILSGTNQKMLVTFLEYN